MAVLERLLSDEDWNALTSLSAGRVRILVFASAAERGHRRVALGSGLHRVGFKVDYESVEFKFECFFLKLLGSNELRSRGELLASVDCDAVAAVNRTESTRAARPGEVRSNEETVVQRRGKLSERAAGYLSSCTATVGLLLLRRDERCGLLAISDDDTLTLAFTTDKEEIAGYLAECDLGRQTALRV
jgi:hypothetical protein